MWSVFIQRDHCRIQSVCQYIVQINPEMNQNLATTVNSRSWSNLLRNHLQAPASLKGNAAQATLPWQVKIFHFRDNFWMKQLSCVRNKQNRAANQLSLACSLLELLSDHWDPLRTEPVFQTDSFQVPPRSSPPRFIPGSLLVLHPDILHLAHPPWPPSNHF